MTNPEEDPELLSVFTIDDTADEDSDEEYYPMSPTGKTLREVEEPYDKSVRIQQANRELFSQPGGRKKQPVKVTFDPVPKLIVLNENGDVKGLIELTGLFQQSSADQGEQEREQRQKDSCHRRQTPMFLTSRHTSLASLPAAPRLTTKPKKTTSQP